MSTHTPGPWTVVQAGNQFGAGIHAPQSIIVHPGERHGGFGIERDCDAYLIAAAPALLAAAKRVLKEDADYSLSSEAIGELRAAISAAEPENPAEKQP